MDVSIVPTSKIVIANKMITPHLNTNNLSYEEICDRIERLTTRMMNFWKSSRGWSPIVEAELLNRSMLEWQASLSSSLRLWLSASSDGELILAWVNLGILVEGQLKLFLSVWYKDYSVDVDAIKNRHGILQNPDECKIELLRQFFNKKIWIVGNNWNQYVELVQQRRNAIHAFKARDIGTFNNWREALHLHLSFVRDMNKRLPYPDDIYVPTEQC